MKKIMFLLCGLVLLLLLIVGCQQTDLENLEGEELEEALLDEAESESMVGQAVQLGELSCHEINNRRIGCVQRDDGVHLVLNRRERSGPLQVWCTGREILRSWECDDGILSSCKTLCGTIGCNSDAGACNTEREFERGCGNGQIEYTCSVPKYDDYGREVCEENGATWHEEQCDDGNTEDGDGCSRICTIESLGVPFFDFLGLEIANNDVSPSRIEGETLGAVTESISARDLGVLANGVLIITNERTFAYTQKISFPTRYTRNNIVKYVESDDDVTFDYFFVRSGDQIAQYDLTFNQAAVSNIQNSAVDDLKGSIYILGDVYSIVKTSLEGRALELTLLSGGVGGVIREGESETFYVGGNEYNVLVMSVTRDAVRLRVNEEQTPLLSVGDIYRLADDFFVGLKNIEGDSAAILLEANKIVLADNNVQSIYEGEMTINVNDESIHGADATIIGGISNNVFQLREIIVNMTAQDDYYVPSGRNLSYSIHSMGDDRELLFTNNWDVEYRGLTDSEVHDIKLDSMNNNQRYEFSWYDGDGNLVDMPIAFASGSDIIHAESTGDKALVLREGNTIQKNDYFVLTGGLAAEGTAKSYLMQYKGADRINDLSPKIKFRNIGSSETREYAISSNNPRATMKLGGINFTVFSESVDVDDFDVTVDLNGDGEIGTSSVSVVDAYGAEIVFSESFYAARLTPTDSASFTISTPNREDYDDISPTPIVMRLSAEGNQMQAVQEGLVLLTPEGEENIAYGYTSMGAEVTYTSPNGASNELTYEYPQQQKLAQVRIVTE